MSYRVRVLVVIAVAMLPLLVVAGLLLVSDLQEGERRIARDRISMARAAALMVESYVDGNLRAVESLAADMGQVTSAEAIDGVLVDRLGRVLDANPDWQGLALHDAEGWNFATRTAEARSVNIGDRPYFRQAIATGEPVVSSAVIGRVSGLPTVIFAAPVTFTDGERGLLIAPVPTKRLAENLDAVFGTDTLRITLVDQDGQTFVHPDPARVAALVNVAGAPDVDRPLAGETGSGIFDRDGSETLVAFAPVANAGWAVRIVEETSNAFAPTRLDFYQGLGILAVAFGVMGSIGWYLGGRLSRSHEERERLLIAEHAARERAEEAVSARDEFLSIAAHELRNPVAGITGSAQLMQRFAERGELSAERMDAYVDSIASTGRRLGNLVEDLLDVSRLQSGRINLRTECRDLATLVPEIIEEHRVERDAHPFVVEQRDEFCPANVDIERFRQVLANLIENAQKYSAEGSAIRISTGCDDDEVVVSVRDAGIGFPPEAAEAIFEPFGRASNASRQNLPGMGLGLYISRRIAEAHGGSLVASSEGEGRGSTFALTLPRAHVTPPDA